MFSISVSGKKAEIGEAIDKQELPDQAKTALKAFVETFPDNTMISASGSGTDDYITLSMSAQACETEQVQESAVPKDGGGTAAG